MKLSPITLVVCCLVSRAETADLQKIPRPVQLYQQGNQLCGEACLAMLAHVSIAEASEVVRRTSVFKVSSTSTYPGELFPAFKHYGFVLAKEGCYRTPEYRKSRVGLIIVNDPNNRHKITGHKHHWMVSYYGQLYSSQPRKKTRGWNVTYFIEIYGRERLGALGNDNHRLRKDRQPTDAVDAKHVEASILQEGSNCAARPELNVTVRPENGEVVIHFPGNSQG